MSTFIAKSLGSIVSIVARLFSFRRRPKSNPRSTTHISYFRMSKKRPLSLQVIFSLYEIKPIVAYNAIAITGTGFFSFLISFGFHLENFYRVWIKIFSIQFFFLNSNDKLKYTSYGVVCIVNKHINKNKTGSGWNCCTIWVINVEPIGHKKARPLMNIWTTCSQYNGLAFHMSTVFGGI